MVTNVDVCSLKIRKLLDLFFDYPNYIERKFKESSSKDNEVMKTLVDGALGNLHNISHLKNRITKVIEKNRKEIVDISQRINLIISVLQDGSVFENNELNDIEFTIENQIEMLKNDYMTTSVEDNPNRRIKDAVYFVLFSSEHIELIINSVLTSLKELINTHRNSLLLSELFSSNNKCLIVGKNGSGKSTLINNLKQDKMKRTLVLPARKNLVFYNDINDINVPKLFLEKSQKFTLKETDLLNYQDSEHINFFTNLVRTLVSEEHFSHNSGIISKLEKINRIFQKLFPEFRFSTEPYSRKILVSKNNSTPYELNCMSDGEKSIFFYIANVVMAESKTVIVVDEPETHLHPSICSKLWDELVLERDDCYFIFISHDVNFIASRSDATISWCKRYTSAFDYEINPNINEETLNREVLISLLGSVKPILFCEGKLESLDYKIYSILYSDKYTIKPVENHLKVIEYTRTVNNAKLNIGNSSAIGIIDRDYKDDEQLIKLKEDKIFSLPVNEVEMLLMYPDVINSVIAWREDFEKRYEHILKDVDKMLLKSENIELMSVEYCNYKLSQIVNLNRATDKLELLANIDAISSNLKEFSIHFETRKEFLENIFNSDNFEEKLKYCTLKRKITKEIMNRYESEYVERAISKIRVTDALQSYLKEKISIDV